MADKPQVIGAQDVAKGQQRSRSCGAAGPEFWTALDQFGAVDSKYSRSLSEYGKRCSAEAKSCSGRVK